MKKYLFIVPFLLVIVLGTGEIHAALVTATPQQVGGLSTAPVNSGAFNVGAAVGTGVAVTNTPTCTAIKFNTLLDVAIWVKCLIGTIVIPGIFMLAFVVFLWGIFKFMRSSAQKDKEDSKQYIYSGLIGLFIMVSVWGIIKIVGTTLGIDSTVPTLQTTSLTSSKGN